jgi:hypothetical protein
MKSPGTYKNPLLPGRGRRSSSYVQWRGTERRGRVGFRLGEARTRRPWGRTPVDQRELFIS